VGTRLAVPAPRLVWSVGRGLLETRRKQGKR
jgi:hypothetical protein